MTRRVIKIKIYMHVLARIILTIARIILTKHQSKAIPVFKVLSVSKKVISGLILKPDNIYLPGE